MLASVKPAVILTLIVGFGVALAVTWFLVALLRVRKSYPLPTELKAASRRELRALGHWSPGAEIDVEPKLVRAYTRYALSSLSQRKRSYSLFNLWVSLVILGLFLVDPIKHPWTVLFIVLGLITIASNYRDSRRLERVASYSNEAD